MTAPSGPARRWRWLRPWRVLGLLSLLLLLALTVAIYLARAEPAAWRAHQRYRARTTLAERRALAEKLESRISQIVGRVPSSTDPAGVVHDLTIGVEEANAWLEIKLPEWLAYHGGALPPEVSDPMIAIDDGQMVALLRAEVQGSVQIVSLTFDAAVVEPGKAKLTLQRIRSGRLRLPIQTLAERLVAQTGSGGGAQQQQQVTRVVDLLEGQTFDARMELDDRTLTLEKLEIKDDAVDLSLRVAPPTGR